MTGFDNDVGPEISAMRPADQEAAMERDREREARDRVAAPGSAT